MSLAVPDPAVADLTVYDNDADYRIVSMSSVVVSLCMVIGLLVLKLVFGKGRAKSELEKPLAANADLFDDLRNAPRQETTAPRDDRSTALSGISWSSAATSNLLVDGFNKVLEFFADRGTKTRHSNNAQRLRDIRIHVLGLTAEEATDRSSRNLMARGHNEPYLVFKAVVKKLFPDNKNAVDDAVTQLEAHFKRQISPGSQDWNIPTVMLIVHSQVGKMIPDKDTDVKEYVAEAMVA